MPHNGSHDFFRNEHIWVTLMNINRNYLTSVVLELLGFILGVVEASFPDCRALTTGSPSVGCYLDEFRFGLNES